ncbi:hypothetical protein R80B4_02468 [Fibrobacteres bacterium R8-0-B4]
MCAALGKLAATADKYAGDISLVTADILSRLPPRASSFSAKRVTVPASRSLCTSITLRLAASITSVTYLCPRLNEVSSIANWVTRLKSTAPSALPTQYLSMETSDFSLQRSNLDALAIGISAKISMAYASNCLVKRLFLRSNGALIC